MGVPQLVACMRFVGSARNSHGDEEASRPSARRPAGDRRPGSGSRHRAQGDRALELPRSPLHGTGGERWRPPRGLEDGDACVHAEDPDVGHGDGPHRSSAGVERACRARAATPLKAWVNTRRDNMCLLLDVGDDETARSRHGDAQVHVVLVATSAERSSHAAVQRGMVAQGEHHGAGHDRQASSRRPLELAMLTEAIDQSNSGGRVNCEEHAGLRRNRRVRTIASAMCFWTAVARSPRLTPRSAVPRRLGQDGRPDLRVMIPRARGRSPRPGARRADEP